MPVTRLALEGHLIGRAGTHWAALGRDATATEGTPNADLTQPLVRGARAAELALADPYDVTDADLAGLASASLTVFEDAAELAMLTTIVQNWQDVTASLGGQSAATSDIPKWLLERIKQLRADLTSAGVPGYTDTPTAATEGLSSGWILGPGRSTAAEF